jgi:ABC-type lipoprotein export system ATPase subunit
MGFIGQGQVAAGSTTVRLGAPVDVWMLGLAIALAVLGGLIVGTIGATRAARLRPAEAVSSSRMSDGQAASHTQSEPHSSKALYELRAVEKRFGTGATAVDALRGVDLEIRSGEFIVVAGPSGAGKSTLLHLLGGLDRASAGSVAFEGTDLGELAENGIAELRLRSFGFVFQQFNSIPTLTAAENIEVALAPTALSARQQKERTRTCLEQVGLSKRVHHLPSQLSGGEQQRVAIARALANAPHVLLADEPTGNLDSATGQSILGLLRAIADQEGRTVVLVTHDHEIAASAPVLLHMHDGRLERDARRGSERATGRDSRS